MSLIVKVSSVITDYITSFITFIISLFHSVTDVVEEVKEVVEVLYPLISSNTIFYFWVVDFILPERFRWVIRLLFTLYVMYLLN